MLLSYYYLLVLFISLSPSIFSRSHLLSLICSRLSFLKKWYFFLSCSRLYFISHNILFISPFILCSPPIYIYSFRPLYFTHSLLFYISHTLSLVSILHTLYISLASNSLSHIHSFFLYISLYIYSLSLLSIVIFSSFLL